MITVVLGFVAFLAAADGQTTQVSQCTWNKDAPLPLNTYILGCETPPCSLPQLQNAQVKMIFEAPYNIKSMRTTADVSLNVGPISTNPFPYELQKDSVTCNFLQNSYCPLQKGEIIEYQLAMYIEPFFAVGISATAEFQIIDEETSTSIACIRAGIKIVKAEDSGTKIMPETTHKNATV